MPREERGVSHSSLRLARGLVGASLLLARAGEPQRVASTASSSRGTRGAGSAPSRSPIASRASRSADRPSTTRSAPGCGSAGGAGSRLTRRSRRTGASRSRSSSSRKFTGYDGFVRPGGPGSNVFFHRSAVAADVPTISSSAPGAFRFAVGIDAGRSTRGQPRVTGLCSHNGPTINVAVMVSFG
jgi:hypothetical protein